MLNFYVLRIRRLLTANKAAIVGGPQWPTALAGRPPTYSYLSDPKLKPDSVVRDLKLPAFTKLHNPAHGLKGDEIHAMSRFENIQRGYSFVQLVARHERLVRVATAAFKILNVAFVQRTVGKRRLLGHHSKAEPQFKRGGRFYLRQLVLFLSRFSPQWNKLQHVWRMWKSR